MTRVATPANESVLVHVARHGTAAHVEKLARKFRWTQRRDAAKLAQRQHEQRNVSYFFDIDDEFVLNARLPREIGAVVRKALEAAVEALREPLRKAEDVSAETPCRLPRMRGVPMRCVTSPSCSSHTTATRSVRDRAPTAFKSSCTSIRLYCPSNKPRRMSRIAASSKTARRSRSILPAGSRATRRSSASWKVRMASRSISGARLEHSRRDQPRAESARWWLPLPRLRPYALLRRAPRRALGERRRNETREPDHALRLPPSARARRRLWAQASRTTGYSFSRGRTAGASRRTAGNVSAETFCRARRRWRTRGQPAHYLTKHEPALSITAETSRCQWRGETTGLQSGHRGDAGARAQSGSPTRHWPKL